MVEVEVVVDVLDDGRRRWVQATGVRTRNRAPAWRDAGRGERDSMLRV